MNLNKKSEKKVRIPNKILPQNKGQRGRKYGHYFKQEVNKSKEL
jgi:hypothetical protein